jgi:hypothetical protein
MNFCLETAQPIYQMDNELRAIKNWKDYDVSHLSGRIAPRENLLHQVLNMIKRLCLISNDFKD